MKKVINKNGKGNIPPKKQKYSAPQKTLNEFDPNFDDLVKMMWRTPPLRYKDLKAKLKKEREDREKREGTSD